MRPSSGDLGARLDEAEDVVDEEQRFCPWSRKYSAIVSPEADAEPGSGRLVHLPVDERNLVEHPGLLHLEPEVVVSRGCAHRRAGMKTETPPRRRRCGSTPGSATVLPTPAPRRGRPCRPARTQGLVDDLDPGLEDLDGRGELAKLGGSRWIGQRRYPPAARRPCRSGRRSRSTAGRASRPDGHGDRLAAVLDVEPAGEPVWSSPWRRRGLDRHRDAAAPRRSARGRRR